ncbi:Crp/Fnr family transcriptional regulator [Hyunsoonleella ulvae]|uniref:Crp/Fnr family transcriptional regulator n=1 Tax=Hyunsoonleella ulvae TaxID=2799948 RepID=UPI00193A3943|nr:Crp/Fnr family transcriptional regulator [Hyunsoonleella ulvae]
MFNNDEFLDSFGHIPEDTFLKLKGISQFKKIDANTQLDELGKVPSKVYLLISGVMRCYVTSESGKEFNKRFFFAMDFAGSLTALIKNAPSEIVYETITQCTLYEIDYKELREMCATDIVVSNLYTSMLEKVFMRYEKRQLELISLNASQRYLKLKSDIPDIDKLVPQYHIASYLSITPVQLSRIRKKLKESLY